MDILYNIGKVITILLILAVSIYFYINTIKISKSEILKNETSIITKDFKVYSIISFGFLDRGSGYSYCKFKINQDKSVSLYFRNSFPSDVYYGPFLLANNKNSSDKKLAYYVKKFEREKDGKTYMHIKMKTSIISSYKIYIEYIEEETFLELKQLIV